jgi:hypothetical protein
MTYFLLATDVALASALLRATEEYLGRLEMKILAPKCTSFQIAPTKDSWYVTDPGLTLTNGEDPGCGRGVRVHLSGCENISLDRCEIGGPEGRVWRGII